MFFFLAIIAATFILSAFLAPKTKVSNAEAAGLNDFSFPRAKQGDPVPRIYGTVKLESPNVVGQANFDAVPIKKKVKTGLFSSKKVVTGFKYKLGLDLVVCLGQNIQYRTMWFGKHKVWGDCPDECYKAYLISLPELFGGKDKNGGVEGYVAFYCGDYDQPQDAYLAANLDPKISAYPGIAHVVFCGSNDAGGIDLESGFYWGNSPSILAISFEVSSYLNNLGLGEKAIMPNQRDVNPIEILYDLYTNGWGNLAIDPNKIDVDNWISIGETIYDEGNGMSLVIANATEGKELSKQILAQINAVLYEDPADGLFKIALIRNDYVVGDLPIYGPGQVKLVRNFTKKLWSETYNRMRIKYTDRDDEYAKDAIATADDFANIRYQGRVRDTEIKMPGVYTAELANELAARELSNVNVPLYQCDVVFDRSASALKPGAPFVLQWPEYNITQLVLRARKFNHGTIDDGTIVASCVQDEFSSADVIVGTPEPSFHPTPNTKAQDISEYAFFEIPYFLDSQTDDPTTTAGRTRYGAFAIGSTYANSFDAYIEDGASDILAMDTADFPANATLSSAIDRFAGFTDGVLASIEIAGFSGDATLLGPFSEAQTRVGYGLIVIGDEFLSFESSTDNGGGSYTLSTVRRARIDSGWQGHYTGDRVWFIDGQESFFDTDNDAGAAFTAYLIERTSTGVGQESTADKVVLTPVSRIEAPMPPDYLTADTLRQTDLSYDVGDVVSLAALARARSTSTLDFEDDGAGVAESGTTYRIGYEINGTITVIDDDEALPYDLTLTSAMKGNAIIHVWAKRDGIVSYSPTSIPLLVSQTSFLISENGDTLAVEGTDLLVSEN